MTLKKSMIIICAKINITQVFALNINGYAVVRRDVRIASVILVNELELILVLKALDTSITINGAIKKYRL